MCKWNYYSFLISLLISDFQKNLEVGSPDNCWGPWSIQFHSVRQEIPQFLSLNCGIQCTYLSLSETELTRLCRCRLAAIDEWCWLLCTAAGLNMFGLSSLRGFFDMVLFFEHFFKEHSEICGKPAEVDDSETTWSSPTKVCLIYKVPINPFHTALCQTQLVLWNTLYI